MSVMNSVARWRCPTTRSSPRARRGSTRARTSRGSVRIGGRGWSAGSSRTGGSASRLAPIRPLLRQRIALQPFSLPRGEVEVLHAERRERAADIQARAVEGGDLPQEDADGRAVRDDVMEDEPQHVVVVVEPQEPRPEQGAGSEVERTRPLRGDETNGLRLGRRPEGSTDR